MRFCGLVAKPVAQGPYFDPAAFQMSFGAGRERTAALQNERCAPAIQCGQVEAIHLEANRSRSAVRMDARPGPTLGLLNQAFSDRIEVYVAEGVVMLLHISDGMIVIAGLPKRAVPACPVEASRRRNLERIHEARQGIGLR